VAQTKKFDQAIKNFLKVFEGVIGGTFAKVPPNKNFSLKSFPHKTHP
jgi:hypothetical protein